MPEETLSRQAARAAYGWGRPKSWTDALALIAQATDEGEADAARQLKLVTQEAIEDLLTPPRPDWLTNVSSIGACRGFAPPGFSEWLIDHSKGRMKPAPVTEGEGARAVRTALACAFGPLRRDLILAVMQERAARLFGIPVTLHEPPNAISYDPGQEFGLHSDYIDPSVPEFRAELGRLGQRTATIVTYLNDDFEGGETLFPDVDVRFRGRTGDAIAFSNVLKDGTPDYNTKHCGLPPTRGRKWVLSQWIRSRPFPYLPQHRVAVA